jgi:hypothetical protein
VSTPSGRRARRRMWTPEQDIAVERLAAVARCAAESGGPDATTLIHRAVIAARAEGVGWTRIGDALGIAGGNAYQKYRKPLEPDHSDE